jgi:hypothetical protein
MKQNFAERFFPKNHGKTLRRREEALSQALNSDQIASLLSMRFNRKPLYEGIEDFYTPEYRSASEAGMPPAELSKIGRYRNPTEKEVCMLFCDVHSKEKMYEVTGGQPGE